MNFEDISVGVTAFLRPEKLDDSLRSVRNCRTDFTEVVVAGNGPGNIGNQEVAEKHDARFLDLDFDCGVSKARNRIVQETDSEYVLLLDDDVEVPRDVSKLVEVLDLDSDLAGVSGSIREDGEVFCGGRDLKIRGSTCIRSASRSSKASKWVHGGKISYYKYDFVPTPGVYRVEALREIGWDQRFRIGKEHLDFFLSYLDSDWSFAVRPEVEFSHNPGGNAEFQVFRNDRETEENAWRLLSEKWGVRRVADVSIHSHRDSGLARFSKNVAKHLLPKSFVGEIQRREVLVDDSDQKPVSRSHGSIPVWPEPRPGAVQ